MTYSVSSYTGQKFMIIGPKTPNYRVKLNQPSTQPSNFLGTELVGEDVIVKDIMTIDTNSSSHSQTGNFCSIK